MIPTSVLLRKSSTSESVCVGFWSKYGVGATWRVRLWNRLTGPYNRSPSDQRPARALHHGFWIHCWQLGSCLERRQTYVFLGFSYGDSTCASRWSTSLSLQPFDSRAYEEHRYRHNAVDKTWHDGGLGHLAHRLLSIVIRSADPLSPTGRLSLEIHPSCIPSTPPIRRCTWFTMRSVTTEPGSRHRGQTTGRGERVTVKE